MKNLFFLSSFVFCFLISCHSLKPTSSSSDTISKRKNDSIEITQKTVQIKNDTIRIANDSLEYEVIIIDPGFSTWINTMAQPRNYHSLVYLENKNQIYVQEWNNRVMQPQRYRPDLYGMTINYESQIHYGYEVNYLLYNYMIYFQNTFKQKLNGYVPMR